MRVAKPSVDDAYRGPPLPQLSRLKRVGIGRTVYEDFQLPRAVEATLRGQMSEGDAAVEHASASADDRRAPDAIGDACPRSDVVVIAEVRLHFVTRARHQREPR